MCSTCGCEQAGQVLHKHDHKHEHHDHPNTHHLELGVAVLAHNDAHAQENRQWLDDRGVRMLDIVSSPGSGKTALLETTLDAIRGRLPCALIVGDVATDNDAQRLKGRGAEVVQIETQGACHLDAVRIAPLLPELAVGDVKLVIIENVGNLVCPAAFDLGQHQRIALLSVTEGEDKPLKYPALFHRAGVVVLTKCDLLPHLRFDMDACIKNIQRINPRATILQVSAWTGEGIQEWTALVERGCQ